MITEYKFPSSDCGMCPRLKQFREDSKKLYPDFFNAPVPPFGTSLDVELLIVGLAPGMKGANRTGRPFTGDFAGELLYETLLKYGFATGGYDKRSDDGLQLKNCRITNAVKCVPPENKPTGPEIRICNDFLVSEIKALKNLKCVISLGAIAHGAMLTAFAEKKSAHKFAHLAHHQMENGLILVDSYHCSRYNTNTGKLTTQMFCDVFEAVSKLCSEQ